MQLKLVLRLFERPKTVLKVKYWRIAASALVIDKKHEALFENLPQFLGPISVIGIV
jgi:hypothetical protein